MGQIEGDKMKEILDELVQRVKIRGFYKEKFKNIKNFRDLVEKQIFTTKEELAKKSFQFLYNFPSAYSFIFSSSGTTNLPTFSFYTQKDLEIIDELSIRVMKRICINENDIGLINVPLEVVMPGYCMERMLLLSKAVCIPAGTFIWNPNQLWEIIKKLEVTVYMGYPTALMEIIENNINQISNHSLRIAIMGAEPLSETRRKHFENILGIDIYDSWGMSEVFAPLGGECKYKRGNHLATDVVYAEIIDPETKKPVSLNNGIAEGILVLTTLKREGMPLIRYWTNDYVILNMNSCPCGEKTPTIRIKDKFDFMLKLGNMYFSTFDFDEIILSNKIWEYSIEIKMKDNQIDMRITVEPFIGEKISNDDLYEIEYKVYNNINLSGLNLKIFTANWLELERTKPKRKRVKVYE